MSMYCCCLTSECHEYRCTAAALQVSVMNIDVLLMNNTTSDSSLMCSLNINDENNTKSPAVVHYL